MNIILLEPREIDLNQHEPIWHCADRRAQHIHKVLQPNLGDYLRVGLINGNMGIGRVLECTPQGVRLQIKLDTPAPKPLPLTLVLALPRPKVLRRVLQSCTSLGVKQIYLINSYRVEKSYWQTPYLKPEQIDQQLLLGLEQGRDCMLPQVHLRKRFKPFVEDELGQIGQNKRCFIAHPGAEPQPCPSRVENPSVLAIGPEGGFIPYEVEKLNQLGFGTISLGPRILKVETAIPALIGRLFL